MALVALLAAAFGQDTPLGDIARQTRTRNSPVQHQRVVTNDDLPSTSDSDSWSVERQHTCDAIRKRKEPNAELVCKLLQIDMGQEYEGIVGRYFAITSHLCSANNGVFPSTAPNSQSLAAEWQELSSLRQKFDALGAKIQLESGTSTPEAKIQHDLFSELDREVPGWKEKKDSGVAFTPEETARLTAIQQKYEKQYESLRARGQSPWQPDEQSRIRQARLGYDTMRMKDPCGHVWQ